MNSNRVTFKRDLRWWDCAAIILGIILGTGIFSVFPALIAQHNPSTFLILLAWFCGGVFAWFGAMCYAELSSLLPWAGGDYVYLSKAYSIKGEGLVAFLFAWAQIFVIRPSSIAVLALVFVNEFNKILIGFSPMYQVDPAMTAIVVTAFFTLVNMLGVTPGKHFQNVMTIFKIAILLFMIVCGFMIPPAKPVSFDPFFIPANFDFLRMVTGFWSALVLTMWVYGGWNEASYVAEEAKDPARSIPKALFAGIFWVTIIYMCINFVYIRYFTPAGLAETFSPASDLMAIWFGARGSMLMSLTIMISAAGAMHGLIMTGGRMSYAVADDFNELKAFSVLHPTRRTPGMALLANFVICLVLLVVSKGEIPFVENLTFYTAGVFWYFFALVVIGLIIIRKQVAVEEIPFRVPFYPVLPILFFIMTIGLIWASIKYKPIETLAGIAVLNIGIPLYYFLSINRLHRSGK